MNIYIYIAGQSSDGAPIYSPQMHRFGIPNHWVLYETIPYYPHSSYEVVKDIAEGVEADEEYDLGELIP